MSREMTHAEIAVLLGVSPSYVSKVEKRALRKLREALERIENENVANQFRRETHG